MPKKKKIEMQKILTGSKTHAVQEPYPNGTQAFVPVQQIKDGIVCTKDGRYVKILEVLPVNFHLKSPMEQETIIYYFAAYLKIAPDHLQILVRTQHADIDAYCANMEACYNREENQSCKEMILETAQTVNRYVENEAVCSKQLRKNGSVLQQGNIRRCHLDGYRMAAYQAQYSAAQLQGDRRDAVCVRHAYPTAGQVSEKRRSSSYV